MYVQIQVSVHCLHLTYSINSHYFLITPCKHTRKYALDTLMYRPFRFVKNITDKHILINTRNKDRIELGL